MVEAMKYNHPKFAVVGHPNKGKSSIVATLALDDAVMISDTPGTTTKSRSFPLKVDGKVLYELFDTPGFQRARRVLAWLNKHEVSADKKHTVVEAFIEEHREDERFNDEVQLLTPIMQGAGIIYVVDGSKPYGEEYEAEMEILRWTGQPSMALINPIDPSSDYSEEWKRALGHYFRIVRTYNPMQANRAGHMRILESMAHLNEEWIAPVKASMKLFDLYHQQMMQQSAALLAALVSGAVQYVEKVAFEEDEEEEGAKEKVEQRYKKKLRDMEVDTQAKIEQVWNHGHIEKSQTALALEDIDLFSKESESVFGLTRKELMITGATSGAVTGAGVDLLFAGHTLLLGGAIGALVGGAGAYFGFNELSEIKVLGQSLGKRYVEMGPMENRNFPYILLSRGLYHATQVANRSHANRAVLDVTQQRTFRERWLTESHKKSLEQYHKKFRASDVIEKELLEGYAQLLLEILHTLIVD